MKRILAVLLAVIVFAALSVSVLAQETKPSELPKEARIEGADDNTMPDDAETTPEKTKYEKEDKPEHKKPGSTRNRVSRSEKTANSMTLSSASNDFMLALDARQSARTEGDFAALGDDTEVSRGVGGNVYTAGRNVMITDDEELRSIVAAGVNVSIHVKKADSIYAAGGDVNVQADEGAEGVYAAGAMVTVAGKFRDGYIAAGTANISGAVAENLTIRSDNIMFGPDTTVGGEITILSNARPNLPASIDPARVTYRAPGAATSTEGDIRWQTAVRRAAIMLLVSGIVAAIIISLALNAARGGFYRDRAEKLRHYFWRDIFRGVAGIIVIPVLAVLLMITVVGLPIGAVLLALYAVCVYLSPIVAGLVLAGVVFPHMNRFLSGAIMVCAIWLLMLVPYLGIAVTLFTTIYGAGTLISAIPPRHRRDRRRRHRNDSGERNEEQHAHA